MGNSPAAVCRSLEAENAIFACTFDKSCSRLLTAERDKTIKVYTEDEEATPGTHPLNWKPPKKASVTLSDATQKAISEGAQPSEPEDEEALAALGPSDLARFFGGNLSLFKLRL